MENEETSSSSSQNSGSKTPLMIIGVVLVLLVIGGFFVYKSSKSSNVLGTTTSVSPTSSMRPKGPGKNMRMDMAPVTPPPADAVQQQELTAGISTATTQKTFHITGGNYYFVPNKITVNKGDTVTIIIANAGGFHNFVIDEMDIKTPIVMTGKSATVTFSASKTGTFIYYCSVRGHKQKGMWGTLTVQ